MTAKVYNQAGEEVGKRNLPPEIFALKINQALIQQAVVAQLANRRQVLAHTKDRSEVRGGGIKPWRQKGTGRARHGSIRSPLWRHGGVTFGPTKDRNFHLKINKKVRRQALLMSLSDRARNERLILLDKLELTVAKTKELSVILGKLPVKGKLLLLLPKREEKVIKAANNLKQIKLLAPNSLNIIDILWSDYLLLPAKALEVIEKIYRPKGHN